MTNDRHMVFLLGVGDLEMYTIRQMLKKRSICYYDRRLQWNNACLSEYKEELERFSNNCEYQLVGIELQNDIPSPENYICIDHHNMSMGKRSSLEQVAELLGITLDRTNSWLLQMTEHIYRA